MRLMKFFEKTKGSISIFLILIMLPMFTCAGLMVDGARLSAARMAASGAGDLAMNAALTNYDDILQDVYGLFAISKTDEELKANVETYFTNTLENEGILIDGDSYTQNYINSIGSMFSDGDVSFDNIVDTKVDKFTFKKAEASVLAKPDVLERQIVEYMKYRGPINMGSGLLSKLKCISETNKQMDAVDAKVEYEEKLDDVQDVCEDAYEAIADYNRAIAKEPYKISSTDKGAEHLTAIGADLSEAKSKTNKMTQYILLSKSPSMEVEELTQDEGIKQEIEAKEASYTGKQEKNKNKNTYYYITKKIKEIGITLKDDDDDDVRELYLSTKIKELKKKVSKDDSISSQIDCINFLNENKELAREAYTYLTLLEAYYDKYVEELEAAGKTSTAENLKQEFKECKNVRNDLEAAVDSARALPDFWNEKASNLAAEATALLSPWYQKANDNKGIIELAKVAVDALDDVLDEVDELAAVRSDWGGAVEKLSDNDIKTSMEGDYKNSADAVDEEAVKELRDAISANKKHFEGIVQKLESVTFYGTKICIEEFSNFSKIPEKEITTFNNLKVAATSVMENYNNVSMTNGITPEKVNIIKAKNYEFYKFLENTCKSSEEESGDKKEAKKNRKKLIEQGEGSKDANMSGVKKGSYTSNDALSGEISNAIDELASGGAGISPFESEAVNSGSDKGMANECQTNISSVSTMLSGIGDIANMAVSKVCLEEYFTEMFSCYTTGRGENADSFSLSGYDMSQSPFYRSEVEYILFGKDTPKENLGCAKASVFGIRFGLNSVYALTSSYTRSQALTAATAIAGWTGFGVPIVQTVILLVWAMAESMVDLNQLCDGEAVCIYKNDNTWNLSLSGATRFAKEQVSDAVDDIFDKVNQITTDKINDLTGEVNKYVAKSTSSITESIQNSIMASVERLALQVVGESNYSLTKPQIAKRVDEMLDDITTSASGDGVAQKATVKMVSIMKNTPVSAGRTIKDQITDAIYNAYEKARSGYQNKASELVAEMLDEVSMDVQRHITSLVDSAGDELKEQTSKAISEGGEKAKEQVNAAIDKYMGDISGSNEDGAISTSMGASLTFTYKEYLKVFMLLANKQSTLARCAKMIQANVATENSDFNITEAHTMVSINADISVKTTFMDVPVSPSVTSDGESSYSLDFSKIGTGRRNLQYTGILGY